VQATALLPESFAISAKLIKISKEDIKKSQATNLAEVLEANASSSFVSQSGPGGTASLFMRGTNSNHVLVVLDGIVLNDPSDPSDRFDFSSFSSVGLEKIEIYKGSLSSLYGGSAIGGVVYLYSKKLFDRSIKISGGSYKYSGLELGWGKKFNSSSLGFVGDYTATDGLSTKGGDSSRLESDPNRNKSFLMNYKKQKGELNHQLLFQSFTKNQDTDNSSSEDSVSYVDFDRKLLAYRLSSSDSQLLSSFDLIKRESLLGSYQSEYSAKSFALSYQWQQIGNLEKEWINKFEFRTTEAEISGVAESKNSELFAIASQFVYSPKRHKASLGIRADKSSTVDLQSSVNLAYQYSFSDFNQGISLATGFKNPSLYNLYAPTYGNLELKTEKSKQLELWWESLESSLLSWDIRTYIIQLDDLIDLPSSYTEPYENLEEAEIKGFEFSVAKQSSWFTWHLQWTLLDSKDLTTGEALVGRPDKIVQLALQKNIRAFDHKILFKSIGRRKKYSSGESAAYDRIDYYLSKNWQQNSLSLKVENLLNKHIESVSGFTSPGRFVKLSWKRSF
jgi:vitamin B12 transporter